MRLAILRELSRGPAPLALLIAAAGRNNIGAALAQMERDGLIVRDGAQWLATRRATDAVGTLETCDAIDSRLLDVALLALAAAVPIAWGTRAFPFVLAGAAAIAACVVGARIYSRGARKVAMAVVNGTAKAA